VQGLLFIDKPAGRSSFSLIPALRHICGEKKIGHAGTLDPFATGLMVYLVGKTYTRRAEEFSAADKGYEVLIRLGIATDTQDVEGQVTMTSEAAAPSFDQVMKVLESFQGFSEQIPPMFSAKKQQGVRLYELARKGAEVVRPACKVHMKIELLSYDYPWLRLRIDCTKGTYIRTLAHDIGVKLGVGAHAYELRRIRSGSFLIEQAHQWLKVKDTFDPAFLKEL
jgi:tRNA pseudouridine55 synthase